MATYSHIPCPVSLAVKTAGYTIPEGRYARAVVNVIGTGTFTINAVTALAGCQNSVITSLNNLYRVLGTPTTCLATEPGQLLSGGESTNTANVTSVGAVYSNETDQKPLVQDYFLPAGTIINGTGTWRAVVEEYYYGE